MEFLTGVYFGVWAAAQVFYFGGRVHSRSKMPRGLDLTLPKGMKGNPKDFKSKLKQIWKREWENERNRSVNLVR